MKKKIGLFFGSFDPIHNGHIEIINNPYFYPFDQIWCIVTPESPFKKGKVIASFHDRLEMVKLSVSDNKKILASDLECQLSPPYYTANTLVFLQAKYSHYSFQIIMGSDNYVSLVNGDWHKSEYILNNFPIIVYPRNQETIQPHTSLTILDCDVIETSSTSIRLSLLATSELIKYLPLPPLVQEYIKTKKIYFPEYQ
ncbi:MAG: nicotinate (nicotinamide) nucleotide adenylyltransferase [Flavobacteriales bacterium]|nr:nicotinate (nicotinamide) nucleotide adenylyltransferase [Flavobacteriales bacterium]